MLLHGGVGLLVQGGVMIGALEFYYSRCCFDVGVGFGRVAFEGAREAKHKRDQGVSKMRVSGGTHGLANGPHLAMKKAVISLIHRCRRRQYVAPARGG